MAASDGRSEITYPRSDGNALDPTVVRAASWSRDALGPELWRFLRPPSRGRRSHPGPGAEAGTADWRPKPPRAIPSGWPDPDDPRYWPAGRVEELARPTCAFAEEPVPVVIPAGSALYRVVGRTRGGLLVGTLRGSWWMPSPPPETEAEWRSRYAVCEHWNGDGGFVTVTLRHDVKAWTGPAAAHASVVPGYVFRGGGMQVWVPPGTIDPLEGGRATLAEVLRPTPWRRREVGL